jgi:hypothetical protein
MAKISLSSSSLAGAQAHIQKVSPVFLSKYSSSINSRLVSAFLKASLLPPTFEFRKVIILKKVY